MKVYRLWTDSNHKIQYTLGYFSTRELAEKALKAFNLEHPYGASSPERGIEEIDVITGES